MTTDVDPAQNGHMPDARERVLDALGNEFSAESLRVLSEAAIPADRLAEFGIRAVAHPDHVPEEIDRWWVIGDGRGPGMIFEWRDLDRTVIQFRPDTPVRGSDGKDHKYIAATGSGTFLNHLRDPEPDMPVLFVEGSKQGVSAAVWAPAGWGVVSVPGCNNWVGTDLAWAEGRKIVVLFDKDIAVNRDVYNAAAGLKEALEVEGASEVVFARLAGARDKDGLDDVLGRRPADRRTSYIQRIADMATATMGRAPARRNTNPYFGDNGLLAQTASLAVLEGQPAALASGGMIALYRSGVFLIDQTREPMFEQIKTLLGEEYRPQWRQTIEEYLIGELSGRGMRLPDRTREPILNCRNTMVDLRTGETFDHDPKYLSAAQIPVDWTGDPSCPVYEAWLADVSGTQGEALEEVAATMLDPSRTPQKAVFLIGPTKSGKSTFLRIMAAIAGRHNMSAVTLHQLAQNKFMGAELYGRMLNVAADLSSAHVEDTSLFKMLTGEDPVQADRKYGKTFSFTNRALFAFSANEIPTVSETSRAYIQRIAPFGFKKSFAGSEDPRIEDAMIQNELPGILARWAESWRRFSDRGLYLPADPSVQEEFETSSDRVARWVAVRCDVHRDVIGQLVGADQGDTVTALYTSFKRWVEDDGSARAMSKTKFSERLRTISGVGDVRLKHKNKNLGLNITTHGGEDRERVEMVRSVPENDGVRGVRGVGSSTHNPMGGTSVCAISQDDLVGKSVALGYVSENPHLPHLPTPDEGEENGHGRNDDSAGVRGDVSPESGSPVPGEGREARGETDPGSGGGTRHAGGSSGERHEGPRDGGSELPGRDLPAIDPPAGVRGDQAVTKQPTLPTPAEEWIPDPFADYEPPADAAVPVGIDLETYDANAVFSHPRGEFVRLVGAGPSGAVVTGGPEVLEMIGGSHTLVGHNLALFDLPALDRHNGIPVELTIPRAHDLRFVAFQADPPTASQTKAGPGYKHYSLDALCGRYLDDRKSALGKALEKEYGGWGNIPFTDTRYHDYCRDDVEKTLALAQVLPMTDYDRREMRVAAITARATLEGFRVDLTGLQRRVEELAAQSAQGRQTLSERFGFPLTNQAGKPAAAPQRTKAGKQAFEAALTAMEFPVDPWPRGKDGTLSLSKEIMAFALETAVENGWAEPELIIKAVQEMNGVRSNAGNILRYVTGDRVHPSFEPFQTTGRWSVKGPGLTVAKKGSEDSEREFMIADPGCVLICFDADQVDIRCVAGHSQDPNLMAIMADPNRDIHNEISDLAFGRHDDPYRHHAKSCDLGWLYGRSVNGLANTPGMPEGAAQRVDDSMRQQFGRVMDWQHEVRRLAEGGALLDNGFGRHMRCDEGREYTQAPAMMGQSATRDIVAEGLLRMSERHPDLIPMLRVIVHDEIVMSVPEGDVEDIARAVIGDLTQEFKGVPITWGRSPVGRTWGECYRKNV